MKSFVCRIALLIGLLLGAGNLSADVKLANVFSDNMVLQRDTELVFWGTSDPGDEINISFLDRTANGKTDESGNWQIRMKPIGLGEPFEVLVKGNQNEVRLKNVVAGDVWICSGQSNMEWTVSQSGNPDAERSAANFPMIRHVKINRTIGARPLDDVPNSGWQVCTPETAGNFTAVGYYFGRHLHQELNVPIGLLNTSWGGTICEAWASGEALKTHPDFNEIINQFESVTDEEIEKRRLQTESYGKAFWAAFQSVDQRPMHGLEVDDSSWKETQLPARWATIGLGNFDGVAWYRRRVNIPTEWVGKDLKLSLGKIDDFDATFVNGKLIGETKSHTVSRSYSIPAASVTNNSLLFAVRVTDTGGAGGFYSDAKSLTLGPEGEQPMSLAGKWRFELDQAFRDLPPKPERTAFSSPNTPTALYNAMIHPLVPFAFRGAVWYQGESNVGRGRQYRTLFPLMINDWRKQWGKEFPFYWVQLANFTKASEQPGPSGWAEIREAQSMTLKLPQSGQAVIIDIGEANDIHPKNKQDVGRRLAFNALAKEYGKKILVYSGPMYKSMKIEGASVRISFDYVADGLESRDGELRRFEIAGEDKKFVWANAVIDGNEVVVSASSIPQPVAVRYAWADNPAGCNLYNSAGLPASPFRTDVD